MALMDFVEAFSRFWKISMYISDPLKSSQSSFAIFFAVSSCNDFLTLSAAALSCAVYAVMSANCFSPSPLCDQSPLALYFCHCSGFIPKRFSATCCVSVKVFSTSASLYSSSSFSFTRSFCAFIRYSEYFLKFSFICLSSISESFFSNSSRFFMSACDVAFAYSLFIASLMLSMFVGFTLKSKLAISGGKPILSSSSCNS